MPFCFHTFMPMKQNMSFAGFRLSRAALTFVTNFCSWFIVITKVVKINVFFGFVLWFKLMFSSALVDSFPSYFVETIHVLYTVSQIISTSISAVDLMCIFTRA